jgi:hypothetical protein
VEYWDARRTMDNAISRVKNSKSAQGDCRQLVDYRRAAKHALLLTPAPG